MAGRFALADSDHVGDLNEMIVHPLPAVETSGAGRLDDGLEIPVIRVAMRFDLALQGAGVGGGVLLCRKRVGRGVL